MQCERNPILQRPVFYSVKIQFGISLKSLSQKIISILLKFYEKLIIHQRPKYVLRNKTHKYKMQL